MTFLKSSRRGAVALIAVMAACGGKAIVDPPLESAASSSGSGAAGPSTTVGVTATTSTADVAVSSSSGIIPNQCGQACETLSGCDGDVAACESGCESIQATACGNEHQAWLGCVFGFTNTMCGEVSGVACAPQLEAYLDCSSFFAGELGCAEDPDGGCECSVFVSPGFELTQRCNDEGKCECLAGGASVGVCPDFVDGCSAVENCCAGLFYTGAIGDF